MSELKLSDGSKVMTALVYGMLLQDWTITDLEPLSEVVMDPPETDVRTVRFSTEEGFVYVKLEIVGTESRIENGDT